MFDAIKRLLTGSVIAGIEIHGNDVVIYKQGKTRNTSVKLGSIIPNIKSVNVVSSIGIPHMEVSKWVNSDEFFAPNSTIPDAVKAEPLVVDPLKYIGRTILSVGAYVGTKGRNKHVTISLRTGIITEPDPKKPNAKPKPPKIETLVIGIDYK